MEKLFTIFFLPLYLSLPSIAKSCEAICLKTQLHVITTQTILVGIFPI